MAIQVTVHREENVIEMDLDFDINRVNENLKLELRYKSVHICSFLDASDFDDG